MRYYHVFDTDTAHPYVAGEVVVSPREFGDIESRGDHEHVMRVRQTYWSVRSSVDTSVFTKAEMEADPDLRPALAAWKAGDDTVEEAAWMAMLIRDTRADLDRLIRNGCREVVPFRGFSDAEAERVLDFMQDHACDAVCGGGDRVPATS